MEKEYRGVIVATDIDSGVLFAVRTDSPEETGHIMWFEMLRLLDEFAGGIQIENFQDGFGELVTRVQYNEGKSKIEYKLCFDESLKPGAKEDNHESTEAHRNN